jgi:hypothetical protein
MKPAYGYAPLPSVRPTQPACRRKITGRIGLTYGCMDLSVFTISAEGDEIVLRRGSAVELRIRPLGPDVADVVCLTDGTLLPFRIPRGSGEPVCQSGVAHVVTDPSATGV